MDSIVSLGAKCTIEEEISDYLDVSENDCMTTRLRSPDYNPLFKKGDISSADLGLNTQSGVCLG